MLFYFHLERESLSDLTVLVLDGFLICVVLLAIPSPFWIYPVTFKFWGHFWGVGWVSSRNPPVRKSLYCDALFCLLSLKHLGYSNSAIARQQYPVSRRWLMLFGPALRQGSTSHSWWERRMEKSSQNSLTGSSSCPTTSSLWLASRISSISGKFHRVLFLSDLKNFRGEGLKQGRERANREELCFTSSRFIFACFVLLS